MARTLSILLLSVCAALAGCTSRTTVSVTGNAPAQYSHVYLTLQGLWFNTSSTAGPDDTSWVKFALDTPVTFDLATSSNASLAQIATNLKLAAGTYSQVRLLPVDSSAALADSAKTAGALYNAEADYVDGDGTLHQLPLELLNPDKGIGIQTSISITGKLSSGDSSSTTNIPIVLKLDGARDLALFTYDTQLGVLLSAHASAYNLTDAGAIRGQLTLSGLSGITAANDRVDIQVSAESLSADGTRHFIVNSAPVSADGSFELYPLATDSNTPSSYDLVIHGPAIATIIVKGVTVEAGDPSSATPVSIGTLAPRAADSYSVSVPAGSPALPADALVGFYQTLPGSSEVPYLIEAAPVDPFNRGLTNDPSLSKATVDVGTFQSDGATITLAAATPQEGSGSYRVAGSAPFFADGLFGITVVTPATTADVLVPTLSLPAASVGRSVLATVTAATAGKYDRGDLIVSHDGAVVGTVALDTALTQSSPGTVRIDGLPAALYYLSVRVWRSGDPAGTLARQWYPTAMDLRTSTAGTASLTVN